MPPDELTTPFTAFILIPTLDAVPPELAPVRVIEPDTVVIEPAVKLIPLETPLDAPPVPFNVMAPVPVVLTVAAIAKPWSLPAVALLVTAVREMLLPEPAVRGAAITNPELPLLVPPVIVVPVILPVAVIG